MKQEKTSVDEVPKCGHSNIKFDCEHCQALQKKYYDQLAAEGFKDIEYGRDTVELSKNTPLHTLLYQQVNLQKINPAATAYYDAVWTIYHKWVEEGRSERDCLVAELLAKQEGKTGTVRGITAYLKSKDLKPNGHKSVYLTTKEINSLIPEHIQSITTALD